MSEIKEVVIVSAFGRGQWLASELQSQGRSVALIDTTEKMGRWAPEDWEGPFGWYSPERLTASQIERLTCEDYFESVDTGFCLWADRGPMDSMGPLSATWLESSLAWQTAKSYIQNFDSGTSVQRSVWIRELSEKPFQQSWIALLSHQFAANLFLENAYAFEEGRPLSLFSPLSLRRVSRRGYQQSLDWCASKGVQVFKDSAFKDLSIEGKSIQGIEIEGELSGAIKGKHFIWLLSSEETAAMSPRVGSILFPDGIVHPEWCWMRFRFELDLNLPAGDYRQVFPKSVLIIEDPNLPWVNSNLISLQRSVSEGEYDAWLRMPLSFRFQRSALAQMAEKVEKILSHRIPGVKVALKEGPQEMKYDFSDLGPSLFPIYAQKNKPHLGRIKHKNLSLGGPETVVNQDWTGRFEADSKLLIEVQESLAQIEKKQGVQGDRTLHS